MANLVISIEGLVGAGKTSICRNLLNKIPNSVLVNGGNIYRAVVYAMMKNGKKLDELKQEGKQLDIKKMMDLFNIEIKIENKETILYMDNEKLDEDALQSKEASLAVSVIGGTADNKNLFVFAQNLIDTLKEKYHVILSGRSLMKIYPKSDYHFFIVASLEERVRRKCIQYNIILNNALNNNTSISNNNSNNNSSKVNNNDNQKKISEIRENIQKRDELQKQAGFYEYSTITTEIDVTDCKNIEESANKVLEKIKLLELV